MQQQQIQIVRDEYFINSINKILFWLVAAGKLQPAKVGIM